MLHFERVREISSSLYGAVLAAVGMTVEALNAAAEDEEPETVFVTDYHRLHQNANFSFFQVEETSDGKTLIAVRGG